jgi:alanyl-tRNA synthetase
MQDVRVILDFFESKGHLIVPSAPIVKDDPTLMFNSGMAQFKEYFLKCYAKSNRIADTQNVLFSGKQI